MSIGAVGFGPVKVTFHRVPGPAASRAARSRQVHASSGPSPAASPGASESPSHAAAGMIS